MQRSPASGNNFGISVSVSGDNAFVGSHGNDNSLGTAYNFKNLDGVVGAEDKNSHAGSDNNTLVIEGTLNASDVFIGSTARNTGNTFLMESPPPLAC